MDGDQEAINKQQSIVEAIMAVVGKHSTIEQRREEFHKKTATVKRLKEELVEKTKCWECSITEVESCINAIKKQQEITAASLKSSIGRYGSTDGFTTSFSQWTNL